MRGEVPYSIKCCAVDTESKKEKQIMEQIRNSGYSGLVIGTKDGSEIYVLGPGGLTSVPIERSVEEIYKRIKDSSPMPHMLQNICNYNPEKGVLYFKVDEIGIEDLLK